MYIGGEDESTAGVSTGVTREYFCPECGETRQLTSIGILKHKRMHALEQKKTS